LREERKKMVVALTLWRIVALLLIIATAVTA
jgi:hypothetical protein